MSYGNFGYYTITDENSKYTLSANIDFDNNDKFYMPYFSISSLDIYWDVPYFIFERFREFLNNFIKGESIDQYKEDFKELLPILDKDEAEVILDIIDKGIKLGWDKLLI